MASPSTLLPRLPPDRFELVVSPRLAGTVARSTLADDVRRGLGPDVAQKWLPPKHFYDARGSELFDRICELPEYYVTRAEHRLLTASATAIAQQARARELVELGSGMARKTGVLLRAMAAAAPSEIPRYVSFDISRDALEQAAPELLAHVPGLRIRAVVGDFTRDLGMLAAKRAQGHRGGHRRLFAFLGSTIGNLDEDDAPALVRAVGDAMTDVDTFLLGVDLIKDLRVLHAAYNDAQGVTARFNKNVLTVMNRELGADFRVEAFDHEARFVPARSRIEMHLVAREAHEVRIPAVGMTVPFAAGESIHTEISRKFTRASVEETLAAGGMEIDAWFGDDVFALALARKTRRAPHAV